MAPTLRLSVLDQSPVTAGESYADAVNNSIRLAQATEALGYQRYWVAEHHASRSFAGSTPEILIGRIAAATRTMRIGSGGVMLMHYSPLKVAENFRMLELLYPNRIDLGIGRHPAAMGFTAAALAYGNPLGIEYYPTKIKDLAAFLADEPPHTEAFAKIQATPRTDTMPEMWLLGSTDQSALYAAKFGLSFSFAAFIAPDNLAPVMRMYHREFRPSAICPRPQASIGVFAICTDDPQRAEQLALCRDLWRLRFETGQDPGPIPTIEEAANHPFTDAERQKIAERRRNQILGGQEAVAAQLEALARDNEASELVVVTITPDFSDRVRSYELLADAFDLKAAEPETAAVSG